MSDLRKITLANITLPYRTRYQSGDYFQKPAEDAVLQAISPVEITDEDWAFYRDEGFQQNAHMEYSLLSVHFSDALLAFDRVLFHGVALRCHDKAYLICAGSGVGKSTQAYYLRKLRPGEFGIICGDRPILEFRKSLPPAGEVSAHGALADEVYVHPSPWNGKENWHDADGAPLAGVIVLVRGDENKFEALSKNNAVLPLYPQFIHTACKKENIYRVAAMETCLVNSVPIWKLTTFQVPDSTNLLLENLFND